MGGYLIHHGVKGQKWGIRRYQNRDGTLTKEGRSRRTSRNRAKSAYKTKPMVDEIISTLSKDERDKLGLHKSGDYLTKEDGASVVKRILIKDGNIPVSFFDVFDDGGQYNFAIGTRSESEYRGKGYATKAAKRGMAYIEKNKDRLEDKPIIWGVRTDNNASIKIAKSLGFELDPSSYSDDNQRVNYVKRSSSEKAKQIYSDAAKREPAITKDVRSVVHASGATMYGLKHRLKTEESIARKAKSKEIKDAVRYTAILSENDFVNEYRSIRQKMEDRGYTETKCKNYFMQYRQGKVNHKSVQCNYKTPDGYTFEMQFQTKASQRAKDKKVPLYEEARNPKTSTKRKGELVILMRGLADDVNDPQGIYRIKEHGIN